MTWLASTAPPDQGGCWPINVLKFRQCDSALPPVPGEGEGEDEDMAADAEELLVFGTPSDD